MATAPQRKVSPAGYKNYSTNNQLELDDPLIDPVTNRIDERNVRGRVATDRGARSTGSMIAVLVAVLVVALVAYYYGSGRPTTSVTPLAPTSEQNSIAPSTHDTSPNSATVQPPKVDGVPSVAPDATTTSPPTPSNSTNTNP